MPKEPDYDVKPDIFSITYWRKFTEHRLIYILLAGIIGVGIVITFGASRYGNGGGANPKSGGAEGKDSVIVTVNGNAINRSQYENAWSQIKNSGMGRLYAGSEASAASGQGTALDRLITNAIAVDIAKKRKLSVSDADIDKSIAEIKTSMGTADKPASDSDLEELLAKHGVSLSQLRDDLKTSLMPKILQESIEASLKLTEADLEKSYDEVKLRRILVPVLDQKAPTPDALPDAQAQKRIEDIMAKIKGGMDFAKAADEYSKDPGNTDRSSDPVTKKLITKKLGGLMNANSGFPKADQGWYRRGSGEGDAFDKAAFDLKKGEMSGIVKTDRGYQILKSEDTRRNLPKDYAKDKAKLLVEFKRNKGAKPFQDLLDVEKKAAKIVWNDPQFQWRYDYFLQSGNPFSGQFIVPSQEEKDKLLAELRAYAPKHTDDAAANLVLAQTVMRQYQMGGAVKLDEAAKVKLRTEIIAAFEAALKKTEDKQARFDLAGLYHDAKQDDKAVSHLAALEKQMSYDKDSSNRFVYQQLSMEYKKLGRDDLAKKADDAVSELTILFNKEQAERQAQEKAAKQTPPPKAGTATGTFNPGAKK